MSKDLIIAISITNLYVLCVIFVSKAYLEIFQFEIRDILVVYNATSFGITLKRTPSFMCVLY